MLSCQILTPVRPACCLKKDAGKVEKERRQRRKAEEAQGLRVRKEREKDDVNTGCEEQKRKMQRKGTNRKE